MHETNKGYILGIRINADDRAALKTAANDHDRTPSALARIIIVEWLKQEGWQKP